MQILLVDHYAGSLRHGMEYRPFYLSREWVRLGHDVTIAAASCAHVRTVAPEVSGDVTEEEIDGVRYLWFRTPGYSGNGLRRVVNMFAFTGQLLRHRNMLASKCRDGAVIASSTYPLDTFPARRIARSAKATLIFEVHDLWPLSLIELGGMSPFHPFVALLQVAENFAYRHADKVVSILPKAERHMQRHGLAPGRFVCIPNGVETGEWDAGLGKLPAPHSEVLRRAKAGGVFTVLYAGAHGIANALDYVIRAAATLRGRPVTFVLVGQGPEKSNLQRLASEEGAANVVFLPPVAKRDIPALLSAADALLISWHRRPIYRFGVSPNKLIDYMMAGKPVIQAIDAGNDMVSESGCGFTVPPEDPAAIADAVVRLMNLSDAERADMGARGHSYVLARHDYRVLATQFLEVLGAA